MSVISFLPLDLAWSAGVCKGYQNEWQKTLSLILSFEMSHPNTKEEFIVPLSQTLSHQKNHPSLSVWFVFFSSFWFAKQKGEWRDSIPCPWKTNGMREEMKKKKRKIKTINQWKSEMENTQHKRVHHPIMENNVKSKKHVKKMPPQFLKIKHFLCHSFFEFILLLTHCRWLTVSFPILSQPPSQYSWWFHTFFNDLSAPYCRSFSTHFMYPFWAAQCKGVCQNNVRKKQIFPNKFISNILWGEIFVTSVGWEIDTLSPFLLFFSTSLPLLHHFCSYQTQFPQLFQLHNQNDHKAYPLKWKKWEKLVRIQIKKGRLKEPIGEKERERLSLRGCSMCLVVPTTISREW